ncbi:MAG TPA: hypothetical protein PKA64_17350, partial [Myxococcota bacterium]|nr:hypothetical protein [Myxococcota bacterium]
VASAARGAGPCQGGLCLDVLAPVQVVGRRAGVTSSVVLSFVPADLGFAPGDRIVLQAARLRGGRPVAASNVREDRVQATVAGCTSRLSPDYDPAATWDDGSCACPDRLAPTTAADLAPYALCERMSELDLSRFADAVAEMPALRELGRLTARRPPGLVEIQLPAWEGPTAQVEIVDAAALRVVSLPALRRTLVLTVRDAPHLEVLDLRSLEAAQHSGPWVLRTGLTALDLPALASADTMKVSEGPALVTLSLPALRSALSLTVSDDPALEALSLPALEDAGLLFVERDDALRAVAAPALVSLRAAYLRDLPRLDAVELPALADTDWSVTVERAPWMCVTDVPIFASPPRGCSVSGAGNLCDP